jgi:hypothetical protein
MYLQKHDSLTPRLKCWFTKAEIELTIQLHKLRGTHKMLGLSHSYDVHCLQFETT